MKNQLSIALTSGGLPRISYYAAVGTGSALRYARPESAGWQISDIAASAAKKVGQNSTLIIYNSLSYVGFYDRENGLYKFAWGSDGAWQSAALGSGYWGSVAADKALNTVCAVVVKEELFGGEILVYPMEIWCPQNAGDYAGAWKHFPVGTGLSPTLAFTSAGAPLVSYYEPFTSEIRVARRVGGAWDSGFAESTVDVAGDGMTSRPAPAMALDSLNRPHLV